MVSAPVNFFYKMKEYTPFQRKVFKAVSTIPFGQRRSYRWVAKRIGRPHAARAVGLALKKNKDLFVVPCHRVVRADGAIGGYVLGGEIKKMLLDLEKKLTQKA
ncbi:MAG: MGMT family protein [Candidatus Omnitrophota bacterium]|nr:MAG: MGMT family protein [Candidatus Omnitrophota bacterium]